MFECPNCGWRPDHAYRVDQELSRLRQVIEDRAITVILDTKVLPDDAATLLGKQPDTLRGWRHQGKHLQLYSKLGGRNYYDIRAIAEFRTGMSEE